MQKKDTITELTSLLSRLIPGRVSIYEGDGDALELFISLMVVGDIDGQRWRRLEAKCSWWREWVRLVQVKFLGAVHSARTLVVVGSLVADGEGLVPDGAGPVSKVLLALALAEAGGVVAEELSPISTITFNIVVDGTVVYEATTRCVAVASLSAEEREGC